VFDLKSGSEPSKLDGHRHNTSVDLASNPAEITLLKVISVSPNPIIRDEPFNFLSHPGNPPCRRVGHPSSADGVSPRISHWL